MHSGIGNRPHTSVLLRTGAKVKRNASADWRKKEEGWLSTVLGNSITNRREFHEHRFSEISHLKRRSNVRNQTRVSESEHAHSQVNCFIFVLIVPGCAMEQFLLLTFCMSLTYAPTERR